MTNEDTLCNFEPADFNACGSEWHEYKRLFEIHLDANGRYGVDGREKVRQLLKCMGQQSTEIYNSFTWAAAIPAIPADEENGVEAQEEIPGENKHDLQTVFSKFNAYFGAHQYNSIKRQVEVTNEHIKSINDSHSELQIHQAHSAGSNRGRGQGRGTARDRRYCERCCRTHRYGECRAFHRYCSTCGEKGHFARSKLCKYYSETEDASVFAVNMPGNELNNDWNVQMYVKNSPLKMEIDTGASCNVLSLGTLNSLGVRYNLQQNNVFIKGVHGQSVKSVGRVSLPCTYKGVTNDVQFQVLDGKRCINLLGRYDCVRFGLIARIHRTEAESNKFLTTYSDVFGEAIGCIPGEYDIKVDEDVRPVVHPPRSVPSALRDKVKDELNRMEEIGILKKVTEPTPWVSSMVVVKKKTKNAVRICIDPSNLNKAIKREHFPMNSIDDIVTRLHGSKYFSTLDANMGFFQIKLSEKSSYLTTFNSPFGRYRYLRMPMGAKCSSEVFQRAMMTAFEGIEGVEIVVDDILVHGSTMSIHNQRVKQVLDRCREINLKLNRSKCRIGMSEVNYVGHRITGDGLKPTEERVKAIVDMKAPENIKELEAVLGMIAYVAKFIPMLSELTAPLRALKQQDEWYWTGVEQAAYDNIKKELTSNRVLKYYNVKAPVLLSVDASTKGLGAAIIQDGGVVAYASRALTSTEQKYAQIEKEMLAVVFGCTRFHKLLYGKDDVTIESDHQPLESLLKKPMSAAPLRIQRMRLKLQPYNFKLIHVSGKKIGLADCLSRLPQQMTAKDDVIDEELMVCKVDTLAYGWHDRVEEATRMDEDLQTLRRVIFSGWPATRQEIPAAVTPYWDARDELSTYNGIVYKGERIVMPYSMRPEMLKILHTSHAGIVKTKQLARDRIYWPGINKQIEDMISKCEACLKNRPKQQKEPMTIHPLPSLPWNKVGTDLFEYKGNHYLILVDYYSNFIEVAPLQNDTKSVTVIKHIKANIARYGIMETLISDNGPQFVSDAFAKFVKAYGIKHVTSSPTYPQSNGLAEKAVQTIKKMMTKCEEAGDDIYLALLDLRNTPRDDVTGSPMQRLQGRRAQTRLPTADSLLIPSSSQPTVVHDKMMEYRRKQKLYHDRGSKSLQEFKPHDAVRVWTPEGWKPAELQREHDQPNSFIIKAGTEGRMYRRNRRDLMITKEQPHVIDRPPPQLQQMRYEAPVQPPQIRPHRDQGPGHPGNIPPLIRTPQRQSQPENIPPPTRAMLPPSSPVREVQPQTTTPIPPARTRSPPQTQTPRRQTRPSRMRKPGWMKDFVET